MNEFIYSSNNEAGLLKSLGPFRISTGGTSITGVTLPKVIKYAAPITSSTLIIFDTKFEIEPFSPPEEDPSEN